MSLRQVQGLDNGLHEEPKSPSSPGKPISDEYELPLEYLLYLKKKKNTNMPFSMGKICSLPGAASPIPCSLTCLACVLFCFT